MAVACEKHRPSGRNGWSATRSIDPVDLRIAGGIMLLLAYLHPFLPLGSGILCPLRAATGVPCPLCGMTTSVVAAAHLDLAGSLAANPMGVVAVGFALYLLVGRPDRLVVSMPLASIALVGMWVFELNRFAII